MADDPTVLEITRRLAVPRAQIWRAWSDPALLAEWWCPKPWTTEVRAFDLRPGGGFHTFMRGPAETGGESDNPGVFLEVVPGERVVFTTMLGAGWRPQTPWLGITAFVTMTDDGDGTLYGARVLHVDAAAAARHDEMGFTVGWGICIDQLAALAATL